MRSLSHDALRQSKDAQDFLEDLGDAIDGGTAARPRDRHESKPLPPPPPPKAEEKKPEEKKP